MIYLFCFLSILFNLEASNSANYDVSNGAVFPSKNSAIIDNPASLNLNSGDSVEVLLGIPDNDDINLVASYSGDFDKIGFGMMFYKQAVNNYIYGALSAEANDFFRLGLNIYFETESSSTGGDIGFRFGKQKGLSGAIVFRDFIGGFQLFTVGLAYALSDPSLIIEADANYNRTSNLSDITIRTTFLGSAFNLNIGYHYSINPEGIHSADNLEAGASFWLTKNIAFIFIYHHLQQPDDIMLGLKLLM